MLVDCQERTTANTAELLGRVGWKQADLESRKLMALRYVKEIDTAYGGTISRDIEDPKVTDSKGTVVVELWVREPSGMRRETRYSKWRYEFSVKGSLSKTRIDSETRR